MSSSLMLIIKFLFLLKEKMLGLLIWICPYGLFLKINKMSSLRKRLIADIDNSINKTEGSSICVNKNAYDNIDVIFNYFSFNNKLQIATGWQGEFLGKIILNKDLEDIYKQINNGIYDDKILEFYKTRN